MVWTHNQQALQEKHPHVLERLASFSPPAADPATGPGYEPAEVTIVGRQPDAQRERFVFVLGIEPTSAILDWYHEHKQTLFRLVLIDPDPLAWAAWFHAVDVSDLLHDPRVLLCCDADENSLIETLQEESVRLGVFGASALISPPRRAAHEEFFSQALHTIETLVTHAWESRRVLNRHGELIQSNLILNIPRMMRSATVAEMHNRIPGHAAIVVGAGPSLDKNVDALKRAPSHAMLIATDTAAPVLQEHGITPDWLVSCDPTTINERHFHSLELNPHTIFAYLPETNPRVLERYASHLRWLCLDSGESATLRHYCKTTPGEESFPRGTNVGFCAYSLARMLGCDPIILVGMDLSMPVDGHTHVSGSANRCAVRIDETERSASYKGPIDVDDSPMIVVDGYHGEPVYTMPHFADTIHRLEWDIERAGRRVIDATEGGALKRGTERMPLADAIAHLQPGGEWKEHLNQTIWPAVHSRKVNPAESLRGIQATCAALIQEAENAEAAIAHWAHATSPQRSPDAFHQGAMQWATRWNEFLHRQDVGQTLDVSLALLRFETTRSLRLTRQSSLEDCIQVVNQLSHWIQQFQPMVERLHRTASPRR